MYGKRPKRKIRGSTKNNNKNRQSSPWKDTKTAKIFDALSPEDQCYILDREIKEKEAQLIEMKNEDYKLSKFLNKVKTPLLMDPDSAKYDPEGLKIIQENEYLRRKVEELEMELEQQEKSKNKKVLRPGETFESLQKKRNDAKIKTKAIILVKRRYDVSRQIYLYSPNNYF